MPGVLTAPGGVAVGSNGDLYVTNNSIYSGIGQVIRSARRRPRSAEYLNSPCGRPSADRRDRLALGLLKAWTAPINMPSVMATGATLEKQSSGWRSFLAT